MAAFLWWTRHGAGPEAPRIGLSVSDAWYDDLGIHRAAYDAALARAGARVVTLRPSDHAQRLDEILEGLDGLLLAGGGDVDPALYDSSDSGANDVDRQRDDFEIDLLSRAEQHGLPVLGICRGCQILAVAHGGKLRNLRNEDELGKTHGITLKSMSAHDVEIVPETRLAKILEQPRFRVNSFHAQAVSSPGRLLVSARAADGVIEALELPGRRMVLGIQWHPEILGVLDKSQQAVIESLVAEARARQRLRQSASREEDR